MCVGGGGGGGYNMQNNHKIIIACAKILFLKCVAIKIAVFEEYC